jgi:hypothetical protein
VNNLCKSISALAGVMVLAFSVYFFNERHDARAENVRLTELRMDQHIIADSYKINRNNFWDLRKKCEKEGCTEAEQKELMELEETVNMERDKLKVIQQQMVK